MPNEEHSSHCECDECGDCECDECEGICTADTVNKCGDCWGCELLEDNEKFWEANRADILGE